MSTLTTWVPRVLRARLGESKLREIIITMILGGRRYEYIEQGVSRKGEGQVFRRDLNHMVADRERKNRDRICIFLINFKLPELPQRSISVTCCLPSALKSNHLRKEKNTLTY